MKPISDINSFAERFAALRAKAAAVGIEVLPDGELERRRIERRKCRAGGSMGSTSAGAPLGRDKESRPTKCEPKRDPKVPRMPYRDAEPIEDESGFGADLGSTESRPTTEPIGANVGVVVERALTARSFSQADFERSGASDSANELFIAHFSNPKNFNQWFTKKFLEDVVMKGKSGCCNNRAMDCRPHFISGGLYIDNKMEKIEGRLQSMYALVRIEDAVSLSAEEKARLLAV